MPLLSFGPIERLIPVNKLYKLTQAKVENEDIWLRVGEIDWIGLVVDLERALRRCIMK